MIKKLVKVMAIILVALIIIFISARYGWKLFGFSACTNPNSIYANKIEVTEKIISLSGDTSASAPAFVGYIYKVSDGNLYIGMKYNLLFGFFDRLGHFDIEIELDTAQIEKIYFKDGSTEKVIWEKSK